MIFEMKALKIFFSETTRTRALIFWYVASPSRSLLVCSHYTPGAKKGGPKSARPGGNMFCIGLYIS